MSQTFELSQLAAEVSAIRPIRHVGRVVRLRQGMVEVAGLSDIARLGDLVELGEGPVARLGEVLELRPDKVMVLADGTPDNLAIGARVIHRGRAEIAPHESWIGRVIDPMGRPLDAQPLMRGPDARALAGTGQQLVGRRSLGARLSTGMAVFNTMLPIVRGQRIGLFAGSGVGKSTLLARLAVGLQADLVVIAMVGERSREVREFVERVLGPAGMQRAIVVAATSDQSPLTRRRCALSAMSIAEHFRDMGLHVLLLTDSITRMAEAHREVALAMGEDGSLRGHPPSTAQILTSLCERAGPGGNGAGDITAVFSVLVAGSDMEEPIADILRGVLDGHIVLDRKIAERGRFPAIDLLRSVSRALPHCATDEENRLIGKARQRLGVFERSEMMVQAGLYSQGSDPEIDAALACWPALDGFLASDAPGGVEGSFAALAQCLMPADTNA